MRSTTFLFALMLCVADAHAQESPDPGNEAIITMRFEGLDDGEWSGFGRRIGREEGANIEYACQRAGVVVLRMQHLSVSQKADVISLVERLLGEAGVKAKVDFLDVHIEPGSWGECLLRTIGIGAAI